MSVSLRSNAFAFTGIIAIFVLSTTNFAIMKYSATICFQCSITSPNIQRLRNEYSTVLKTLRLKCESRQSDVRCSYDGGYPNCYTEVSFLAERDIQNPEAAHWLSMTIQGLAGIYCTSYEGVECFSFSFDLKY